MRSRFDALILCGRLIAAANSLLCRSGEKVRISEICCDFSTFFLSQRRNMRVNGFQIRSLRLFWMRGTAG